MHPPLPATARCRPPPPLPRLGSVDPRVDVATEDGGGAVGGERRRGGGGEKVRMIGKRRQRGGERGGGSAVNRSEATRVV